LCGHFVLNELFLIDLIGFNKVLKRRCERHVCAGTKKRADLYVTIRGMAFREIDRFFYIDVTNMDHDFAM